MTAWTSTAPKEPGWYWVRRKVLAKPEAELMVRNMKGGACIGIPEHSYSYGPRVPSAEAIEQAIDSLASAEAHAQDVFTKGCISVALAALRGEA